MSVGSLLGAVLIVSVVFAGCLNADDLEGRVFLGESLNIKMELKENFFSELLRYLKLRNTPRKVINLSKLGKAGDFVFIGDDLKLYFSSEKEAGAAYSIGSASNLSSFRLDSDVELFKVPELGGLLDPDGGGVSSKLRVKIRKKRPRAVDAKQANFEFWLQEMVFEYDRYDPSKKTEDNFPRICEAIKTALPRDDDCAKEQLANLVFLERYVRLSDGLDLIPLRRLIDMIVKEAEAGGCPAEILQKYRSIREIIFRKTEDA